MFLIEAVVVVGPESFHTLICRQVCFYYKHVKPDVCALPEIKMETSAAAGPRVPAVFVQCSYCLMSDDNSSLML